MRAIDKTVELNEVIATEKKATTENITRYSVDKYYKNIEVSVELKDEDSNVLATEMYTIGADEYVDNVSEGYMWSVIDKHRKKGSE